MFQECPAGSVNEATFKEIYEKFFPYGSKYWSGVVLGWISFKKLLLIYSNYAISFYYIRVNTNKNSIKILANLGVHQES